jgi:hypothetical protein
MDETKINFPLGIFGEPSIEGQKKLRNPRYYGQIRIGKQKFIEYLNTIETDYLYLDMFKQIKDNRKLTFSVIKTKINE